MSVEFQYHYASDAHYHKVKVPRVDKDYLYAKQD